MFIRTESLTKRYGNFTALNACSLSVDEGQIFGLLGPNGSGKSTLIRLLMGFLKPSSGSATIDDLNCYSESVEVHKRVAYIPGDARLFRRMRAKGVLRFFASMRPDGDFTKAIEIADRLDLDLRRRVGLMSTGMRQKLALAVALSNSASVLILDEPTANLDPNVRADVINILLERKKTGQTIILSSHVLSEIEDSCDRVVILRSGELVHSQTMSDLKQRHRISANSTTKTLTVPDSLANSNVQIFPTEHDLQIHCEGDLAPVVDWLAQLELANLRIEPIGLQAVYEKFHSTKAA